MNKIVLVVLLIVLSVKVFASDPNVDQARASLQVVKELTPWPWEEPVTPILDDYLAAEFDQYQGWAKSLYMVDELKMHKWGQSITEFTVLAELLYTFQPEDYQEENRLTFEAAIANLDMFRMELNEFLYPYVPSYNLKHQNLVRHFDGEGIVIGVFDLFDPVRLQEQRERHPNIEGEVQFGDPITFLHGNTVIDIILDIAPKATIVPISTESKTYNEAMAYMRNRDDIDVINMSRAFHITNDQLDPEFSEHLSHILQSKIFIKSIGNTGTDLEGENTDVRKRLGLPPLGSFFTYDLDLIKAFLQQNQGAPGSQNLMFAINLQPFSNEVSLTATVPGYNPLAIKRSFAISGDAVYSVSSHNFESGSSFAAPQLAAISALLLDAADHYGYSSGEAVPLVAQSLQGTARRSHLGANNTGLGLVDAHKALAKLIQSSRRVE
ncbi:hypothetical protein MJO52_11220 [Microbulbifer variabilis]|uniref:Peptidase S8/S53 domain-containing protein n=1 Tax=Microbulbifer variabilis TaxID=266805 RepID=A0ABY4V5W2_9GAMM|nr:hypothetical protein [Microbulbifer variabilis]USD19654.1 hypothetical protein MJO52_11220 [Microbulbifer variabilis]